MHKFWTIPATNLTHTRSQTHTNMVVNNYHEIQTFEILVIELLFFCCCCCCCCCAHKCISLMLLNKWFVHIYLNDKYVDLRRFEVGMEGKVCGLRVVYVRVASGLIVVKLWQVCLYRDLVLWRHSILCSLLSWQESLSCMRLRARDHYTSKFSLVEKAQWVQVHFTLRLRDQRSMWMARWM